MKEQQRAAAAVSETELPETAAVPEVQEEAKPAFALLPGEKLFTYLLLALGLVAFFLALRLWLSLAPPRMSSAAAVPLITSGLWVLLTAIIAIEDLRKKSKLSLLATFGQKIVGVLNFAFPTTFFVMFLAVIAYCICLFVGISFYIATPVFLYGSMCYLMGKGFVKNLLWTALAMAFIYLLFDLLFGVVVP